METDQFMDSPAFPERRKSARITLGTILYLDLEASNGAIVLNISDDGLAFHAAGPVEERGIVRFWFSLSGQQRLEGSGELVWTDSKRKTGGLRFTSLPQATRTHIWNLMGKLPPVVDRKVLPPVAVLPPVVDHVSPPVADREVSAVGGANLSPMGETSSPPVKETNPPLTKITSPEALPETVESAPYISFPPVNRGLGSWTAEPFPEEDVSISFGWIAAVFLVLVLIASGFFLYTHQREAGETLVRLGTKLQGPAVSTPQAQTTPGVAPAPSLERVAPTPPPPSPAAAPPATPAPAKPTEIAPRAKPPAAPLPSTPLPARAATPPVVAAASSGDFAGDAGDEELAAARRYLDGIGRPRNSATAAQLLWTAVAKGNPVAALMLARLYLSGDGVVKSCEQARVLLRAASARGYTEATETLADLSRNPGADCGG